MPESNDQHVFFVDDDLIERLMRGDTVADPIENQASRRDHGARDRGEARL